jgi:hypothetical protein
MGATGKVAGWFTIPTYIYGNDRNQLIVLLRMITTKQIIDLVHMN